MLLEDDPLAVALFHGEGTPLAQFRRAAGQHAAAAQLPMSQHRAGVDSLNVSVAAGVLMYEVVRQRGGF